MVHHPQFTAYVRSSGFQSPEELLKAKPSFSAYMEWRLCRVLEFGESQPNHVRHGRLSSIKAELEFEKWLLEKYPIVG